MKLMALIDMKENRLLVEGIIEALLHLYRTQQLISHVFHDQRAVDQWRHLLQTLHRS